MELDFKLTNPSTITRKWSSFEMTWNPLWLKQFYHIKMIPKMIRNDSNCFNQIWSRFQKSITTQAQPNSSFIELAFVKVHFNEWLIWKWLIKITNDMYGVSGMGFCLCLFSSFPSRRRLCVCVFRSYFALHVMLLLHALCKKTSIELMQRVEKPGRARTRWAKRFESKWNKDFETNEWRRRRERSSVITKPTTNSRRMQTEKVREREKNCKKWNEKLSFGSRFWAYTYFVYLRNFDVYLRTVEMVKWPIESFVESKCNRIATARATAVASTSLIPIDGEQQTAKKQHKIYEFKMRREKKNQSYDCIFVVFEVVEHDVDA